MNNDKIWKGFLLFLVLLLGILIIYSPHYNYSYPLHLDEWNFITEAKVIQNEGFSRVLDAPLGSGFSIFLHFINLFFPLVLIFKFLPALNFLVIGGVLFYFMNENYNYWIGLFSVIFFASLPSNVNILGTWFFVPIIAAVSLVYIYLFSFENLKGNPKLLYLSAVILFLIAFIHPTSFLVVLFVGIIYFSINYGFVKDNYKLFSPFLILIIPAIIVLNHLAKNFDSIIGKFVWRAFVIQINFNPIFFYGLLSSFFALVGFVIVTRRKELLAFRIYILVSLISVVLFLFFEFTVFSSYQRYLYHFMIAAVPLSAIGFYESLRFIYHYLRRYKRVLRFVFLGSLMVLTLFVVFYDYGSVPGQTELYNLITDEDYEAMAFLRDYNDTYVKDSRYFHATEVISLPFPGTAMYAVTNKGSISNIVYRAEELGFNRLARDFFSESCEGKLKISERFVNFRYVYSYEEIDCSFLNEIYRNDKVFLYESN